MAQAAEWKLSQPQPWMALVAWSAEPEECEQLSLFSEDLVIDITEADQAVPDDLRGMYYVG